MRSPRSPSGSFLTGMIWIGLFTGILCVQAPRAWAVDPNENKDQVQEEEAKQTGTAAEVTKTAEAKRPWFFDGLLYTYFMAVRDNQYANDVYNEVYLRGNYDLPRFMGLPPLRVSLRWDFTQRYIADHEESGFLSGDMRLYTSMPFKFAIRGQEFAGRGYFYWTFPTSKISQQEGNIARPTLFVALSKVLPFNLTAIFRPFFRLNWHRYAERAGLDDEGAGGAPNTKWQLGYDVQLLYNFHLHERLSFGGGFLQAWNSKYSARDGTEQPWNSEYYWETFTGYHLLKKPVDLSAYLSLTSGRQTFEDGVWRFYFVERDETQLYLLLSARY